ncbi:MAG: PAS domain-containing sensor histidine kinase [Bacillota bacterium]|nr:PAS domain-containing sensor histidine kinase [Bacillota bacterium]
MDSGDSVKITVPVVTIEQNETYLRNILDSMLDVVIQTDLQGKICYVNSSAYTMFGWEPERIVGKSVFDCINPEDYEYAKINFFNAIRSKKSFRIELRLILNCCRESFWVEIVGTLVKGRHNGETTGVLCIARDIGDRKRAENSEKGLKQSAENEKLRTEFFTNLSHELKTPINVIYSALQVMQLYIENNKSLEKINDYTGVIRQNCHRLIRLVNNLVDVSKIESGYFQVNNKYCNIVSVVEDIVQSVVSFVEYYNMEIVFDTDIEEKYTCCDLDIIERILLNLISNSVKFGKTREVIKVSVKDKDTHILISVKDNGNGIPVNKQKNIFNRFVRGTKSVEGSGIGLSLVKSLVELENGTITLESKEGKGCEFIISFPVVYGKDMETDTKSCNDRELIKKLDIEFSDIYT